MTDTLVEVRGLKFAYGDRPILDGVDLDIRRGRVTAILGPTASGKTTLLQIMTALLRPQGGTVHFNGQDVHALTRSQLFDLRRQIGMQAQRSGLLMDLDVFENVAFPLREHTQLTESMIRDVVIMKLQAVGLRGARRLFPSELSGGMERRVAFARAIVRDPELSILDEPFAGLDPIALGVLVRVIRSVSHALKLTSVVVSHSVEETLAVADDVYLLADGRIQAHGTPDEIRRSPSPWVQQFFNGSLDGPVQFHVPAPSVAQDFSRPA